MPIYEYQCQSCGKIVEVFSQTAAAIRPPESCDCSGKGMFSRLYSSFAAATGGSGSFDSHECCGGDGSCENAGGCCCGGGHCHHH